MESKVKDAWKGHLLPDLHTFKNKQVVVRVDWNMPVINGEIADTSRFDISVPFLKQLSFAGAKIILLTHFGEKGESLDPVASLVTRNLPFISFIKSTDFSEIKNMADGLQIGDAILLENVRIFKGEEVNLPSLSRSFASLGEVFINDAFSVSHREHASVVGIAKLLLSYFGPTFARELTHLTNALNPEKPALMIIGGAKISTKFPLIKKYLDKGIPVFVGGAMAHDIWRARGISIGKSFSDPSYNMSEEFVRHPLMLTPSDVILETGENVSFDKIPSDGVVIDCGAETVEQIGKILEKTMTVIVNGPLGLYEKGWLHGTEQIMVKIANSHITSYIGGGDTVTVAHSLGMLQKFTFVSLGGGAMLQFLSSGTLPGIDAVTK